MSAATVIVTNIAPTAVDKDVTDLFSFCGKIKSIKMRRHYDSKLEAAIVFDSPASVDTALLLANALLFNHPIQVTRYDPHKADHASLTSDGPTSPRKAAPQPALPSRDNKPAIEQSQPQVQPAPAAQAALGFDSVAPTGQITARVYDNPKVIFIGNICPSVDEGLLIRFFDFCGPVLRHVIDRETQTALVEFRLAKSVKIAIICDATILGAQEVSIAAYNPTKHGHVLYEKLFGSLPDHKQFAKSTDSPAVWQSAPASAPPTPVSVHHQMNPVPASNPDGLQAALDLPTVSSYTVQPPIQQLPPPHYQVTTTYEPIRAASPPREPAPSYSAPQGYPPYGAPVLPPQVNPAMYPPVGASTTILYNQYPPTGM